MNSPFKFLDPFGRDDNAMFFGREDEVERLYDLVLETDLLLVYGASGTGKTSIIECGLANTFPATDWFELMVRRGSDINAALDRRIRDAALTNHKIADDATCVEALRSLYLDFVRPIYLIFDQFEELLILGSKDEQDTFYAAVAAILASKVSCKVVIILREEYLAELHRFETVLPMLFDKRLRIEPMRSHGVEDVIIKMTGGAGITLEHGRDTARAIISQIEEPRVGIQLAYLQVYLDRLYQHARRSSDGTVLLTDAAVAETGKLGDILVDFLDDRTGAIQSELRKGYPGIAPGAVRSLLENFVSPDGTKQPITENELTERLKTTAPWLDVALNDLVTSRILRLDDDRYELAHDSLAGRISESRSAERKDLQVVQKLVRDGLSAWKETRTPLSAEELARVKRCRNQQPLHGGGSLDLTGEEEQLIRRSTWRQRRRQLTMLGGLTTVSLLLLVCVVLIIVEGSDVEDAAIATTNEVDWLATNAFLVLGNVPPDDNVKALRQDLLDSEARINQRQEKETDVIYSGEDEFWQRLRDIDQALFEEDEVHALSLAEDLLKRVAAKRENYGDMRWRVRRKAVLWRLIWAAPDSRTAELLKKLVDTVTVPPADAEESRVNFDNDRIDACEYLRNIGSSSPNCRGVPLNRFTPWSNRPVPEH